MSWWFARNKSIESEAEKEEQGSDIDSAHPAAAALLELQRAAGNQSVQNLVGSNENTQTPPGSSIDSVKTLVESPAARDRAGIRLHTDDSAAKSADSLGAAAYTRGRDIYFGAGKYAPVTSEGKELLAHELSHALRNEPGEQSTRSLATSDVVSADDRSEREADSIGRRQGWGTSTHAGAMSAPKPAIHR